MKRLLRISFYILIVVLLLSGILIYLNKNYLQAIILKRLQAEVEATFGNYYRIEYETINTGITEGMFSVRIVKPVFTTDTTQSAFLHLYPVIDFTADSFELGGINIRKLLLSETVELGIVGLYNPKLSMLSNEITKKEKKTEKKPLIRNRKLIEDIIVHQLLIKKGNFSFLDFRHNLDTLYYGTDIDFEMVNAHIPTQADEGIYNASRIENIIFSMNNIQFNPKRSPYSFQLKHAKFHAKQNTILCEKVELIPETSLLKLSKKSKYQKTFSQLKMESVFLRGVDFDKLGEYALNLHYAEIANADFSLLRNRNQLLDKSLHKLTLQEYLHELQIPVKIDTVRLRDMNISFDLHMPKHKNPANIQISHIKGLLYDINNNKDAKRPIRLDATATIMQTGKLHFTAVFPIHSTSHSYRATISTMPFSEWNQVISTMANVKITSGTIDRISLAGTATSSDTKGEIVFEYRDLQATIFKQQKNGELKKAKLMTYVTNEILRLHNPEKGESKPISKPYYFKKEPYQGPVMLWAGGLIDGIEATLLNPYLKKQVDVQEAKMAKTRKR